VVVSKNSVVPRGGEAAQAGVVVVGDVEVPGEVQRLSSNPTGTPVFSSRKPRRACWSPKILFPESPSTAKNEFLSRVPRPIPRSNTGCGTLSVASLLLAFSMVWTISSSPPARCCILVPQVARHPLFSLSPHVGGTPRSASHRLCSIHSPYSLRNCRKSRTGSRTGSADNPSLAAMVDGTYVPVKRPQPLAS